MSLHLDSLSKINGGVRRLTEIAAILTKYGLAEWLQDSKTGWLTKRLRGVDGKQLNYHSTEERIRLALTELGTTGIKLGQMLSTRPDLIGEKLSTELARLQADTPPDHPEEIAKTIEAELGKPPGQLFASFEDQPFASASIGQVHRATLPGGEEVVVKIMHDGIEERVHRDLGIMGILAELMEKHSSQLRQIQPIATARQFKETLLREMDYCHEARHMEEFRNNFHGDDTVRFATNHPDYSSTRVLTMEFLDGISVTNDGALLASGENLNEFARRGANAYLEMIFRDGFYHADPHPGNLLLLEGNVVGILDCGMVGRVDEVLRDEIEGLLLAAITPDPSELVEIVCRIGATPSELDRDALRAELSALIAEFGGQSLDRFDLGGALSRVIDLVRRYHIILPQGFAMLLKTIIMLEGTGRQTNPRFNLTELLTPYCKKAMRRRLEPRRILLEFSHLMRDWHRLFGTLPRDLGDIIARIRSEKIEVHLEHRRLESTVDRLVQGILAAALFVGSALILSSAVPPTIGGLSLLGAVGVLTSVVLAGRLLRTIKRSRS